jgi:hypothetical protein
MADALRLLVVVMLAVALGAGEAAPVVELSAQPAQIAVGETVVVTVTYRWPRGWTVAEPDPAGAFQGLFVTAAPPAERATIGDEERRSFRYTVAAVRSGAWLLPRPAFTARGPSGEVTATAPEVIVQVGTESAPPRLPEPRPLLVRPPEAPVVSRMWWWIGGGAVALIAGIVTWFVLRRRQAESGPTPWQRFERELAGAPTDGDAKESGARISLAVRRYAGAIWNFDGPGLTSREVGAVVRRLRAGSITEDEARDLLRLLSRLDDLRWSAGDASEAAMRELCTLALAWAQGVQRRLDAEAAERAKAGGVATPGTGA